MYYRRIGTHWNLCFSSQGWSTQASPEFAPRPPARYARAMRCLPALLLFSLLTAGCSEPDPVQRVCRDPISQACLPCPGVSGCVDPIACKVIPCADVSFATADAKADAKGSDAATETASGGDSGAEVQVDAQPEVIAGAKPETVADTGAETVAEVAPETVAETVAEGSTGPCQPGQVQCAGNTLQVCQNGKWMPDKACASDLQCQNGICGCKDPCPALNLVQCVDNVPATKTCQLSSSGCLAWSLAIACKPGELCQLGLCQAPSSCNPACALGKICQGSVCVDAPCVPACPSGQSCQSGVCVPKGTGTLTCSQVVACIGNCPAADAACPTDCKTKGSEAGLGLLATYQGCVKAVCKPLADAGKINETMLCIYTHCFAEQKACTGAGTSTCKQLSDCMAGCGGSATCSTTCNGQASQQGALAFYGLLTCIDNICAGLQGAAQESCAKQGCKASWDKCYGSGPALYTTCGQIATCQSKCNGDITCAKACTAAGTPAAQAAVDAFITCRDTKCATYCANPSSPNCMPCIEAFCSNQLAACSI